MKKFYFSLLLTITMLYNTHLFSQVVIVGSIQKPLGAAALNIVDNAGTHNVSNFFILRPVKLGDKLDFAPNLICR